MMAMLVSMGSMAQGEDPMVVRTESGLVKGIDQEGSMAFLGIPYAKVERFMPPKPVDKWSGIRVCDHWGPQAMQNVWGEKPGEDKMSEQCCVLNVWTTDTKASKPVMLWLHGGGFDSGTSEWDPGMKLAQKDVVVVSVNHRLNILGFLDLSTVSEKYKYSGNVGMLDVVQALQWIQKNIRQFGGDPTNVTIFGESGGGGKVGTLLCMPVAKGLFHKAIIMSGTILNVNTKAMTEELGQAVLKQLNIDAKHIDKIKDVPYEELYAAGQRAMAASIGTRKPGTPMMWGFGPTPDGEVLVKQPFQPDFADFSDNIPIMIGTTFHELQRPRYEQKMTMEEARAELRKTFGFDTDAYIQAFKDAYPTTDYAYTWSESESMQERMAQDLLSIDWLFRPKTIITADAIGGKRKADTYVYLFAVMEWDGNGKMGTATHGAELKYCFNVLHHYKNLDNPEGKQSQAEIMSNEWAAFAHNGNPGIPIWHPYTKENGEVRVYGGTLPHVLNNHDRKLAELIDKHCFQQLDEFRAEQKRQHLKVGDVTMSIDTEKGAKIMSLKYKGQEMISQMRFPESFGSTFWTSPQKEWNWPPVQEFDKQPYTVEQRDGRLIATSQPSQKLGFRVRKEFVTDPKDNAIVVTYSIINESSETRKVAPWEITRVTNDGGIIFFDAPLDGITPAGLMPFKAEHGAVWYQTDEANQNRKINADGKGWLAYANKGLLLVKKFEDLKPSQPAPDEAEIQVYVNRGKTWIELESQGAYTTLQPKEQLSWTVRWYLLPYEGDAQPSAELLKTVRSLVNRK